MGMRPIGRVGIAAIPFGAMLMIGGELGGGGLGALAQGYGLLVLLSGLFIVGGFALRHLLGAHHSPAESRRTSRPHAESIR
jgi:hypothetical protein